MTGIRAWKWLAVVPGLLVVSCEKVREVVAKARTGAEEDGSAGGIVEPGGGAAPEMQGLIDLDEQGYRFRRDQPFPGKLSVRKETSLKISNGRLFGRSLLGSGSSPIEGTWEDMVVFERDGSRVSIMVEHDRFVKPIIEGEGETTGEPAASEPAGEGADSGGSMAGLSASFLKRDKGWQVVGQQDDFRVMAWARQLREQLDDYLAGTGVIPNSPWFGPKRLLPGVEVKLAGPETGLILGEAAKGDLLLKFDRVENIGGHPCGVFEWSGDFTIAEAATLSGDREKLEMSVSSGQVWCSLIHPLVLRRESQGVMTVERRGADGKLAMRLQGAVESTESLLWTAAGG